MGSGEVLFLDTRNGYDVGSGCGGFEELFNGGLKP